MDRDAHALPFRPVRPAGTDSSRRAKKIDGSWLGKVRVMDHQNLRHLKSIGIEMREAARDTDDRTDNDNPGRAIGNNAAERGA